MRPLLNIFIDYIVRQENKSGFDLFSQFLKMFPLASYMLIDVKNICKMEARWKLQDFLIT